jgi:hypothetical protein
MTNLAPGLHSQRTVEAISSARPNRPMGWLASAAAGSNSPLAIMAATMGVSKVPGQMALIRITRGAYSRAALLVSPSTPCLDAWYAARPGRPTSPPSEEQLTMAPLRRAPTA